MNEIGRYTEAEIKELARMMTKLREGLNKSDLMKLDSKKPNTFDQP